MALTELETRTIERDQAEAVVHHLRAALRSVVDGPAGNPTIAAALKYARDVSIAALIREHGPRNAVASLARELRESRTENARLRAALEAIIEIPWLDSGTIESERIALAALAGKEG